MAVATVGSGSYIERPRPSGLQDVIEVILDKGMVIDAYVRVSLIGIEILTIDARIVIASVDTYLRFAEAVGRINIAQDDDAQGLPQLMESMTEGGSKSKTKGALEGAKEKVTGDKDDDDKDDDDKDDDDKKGKAKGALEGAKEKVTGDKDDDDKDDGEKSKSRTRRRSSSSSSSGSSSRSSSGGSSRSRKASS